MLITRRETPKTANLLACKQWWKVCFLHGNQEKYYREIYSQAAATQRRRANYNDFPTTKVIDETENNAINIRDDPFLFGITDEKISSNVDET